MVGDGKRHFYRTRTEFPLEFQTAAENNEVVRISQKNSVRIFYTGKYYLS